MSVINQVLLELEKRRASGAERAVLPDHVRALPDNGTDRRPLWFAVAAGAGLVLVALAGLILSRSAGNPLAPQGVTAGQAAPAAAIERVAAAPLQAVTDAAPGGETGDRVAADPPLAGRLTFELSQAPAVPREAQSVQASAAAQEAIPSARVLSAPEKTASGSGAGAVAVAASAVQPAPAAATPSAAQKPPPRRLAAAVTEKTGESGASGIEKQVRQPTARELSDNEYRKGAASLHQGRQQDAQEAFRAAINLYAGHHGARQALAALLIESKMHAEAERLLQEGIRLAPEQIGFAMTLARLQVDRGDLAAAVATLQAGIAYAQASPDYVAFLAALLQRQGRHDDAIAQFQAALRAKPATGVWWLGLAVSQQAVNRVHDAQESYRRAKASNNLSPELVAFADQRLRQLQ